jgi:N-methylhydantoinase B
MSLEGDGSVHPPPGLFGGQPGTPGRVEINRRGENGVAVPSKFPYRATQAGDRLLLVAPSGGGYGPAAERDPAAIREDIADEVLSPERAEELYGFEE